MSFIADDEILAVFIEESLEHLDGVEKDILDIEAAGAQIDPELVNKVFRAIHSIKGGSGFLGLEKIKELTHGMENLLNMMRNEELVPDEENTNVLLAAADLLKEMVIKYSESNEFDISDHLVALTTVTTASLAEEQKKELDTDVTIYLPDGSETLTVNKFEVEQARKGGRLLYFVQYDLVRDIEHKGQSPIDVIREIQRVGIFIDSMIDMAAVGTIDEISAEYCLPFFVLFTTVLERDMITKLCPIDRNRIYEVSRDFELISIAQYDEQREDQSILPEPEQKTKKTAPVPEQKMVAGEEPEFITPHADDQFVAAADAVGAARNKKTAAVTPAASNLRVNVKILDILMNLAGELVLTRNQLVQAHSRKDDSDLETAIQRVDLVTSELQETIMFTRMQPIGVIFNKFSRVVRDLAQNLGKEVNLTIDGEDVDLDKTIIEALSDPLTHLVRNAVDHGIEIPEVRRKAGKPVSAILKLAAYHDAGNVIIEVSDDGKGIDPAVIGRKAIEKKLVSEQSFKTMTPKEILHLIFLPGFSTAEQVTDVSGRGVGMDVVKSNLTKIGGAIELDSVAGTGTTIRIKLPLTLAIIPSLVVGIGEDRYAIPQVNLVELVRIPAKKINEQLEVIDGARIIRLRGELLPVIDLAGAVGHPRTLDTETSGANVVVVNAGDLNYGLMVDHLYDSEEIVVKPLGSHLRGLKTYSGATILGDGYTALIIDVNGIRNSVNLRAVREHTDTSLAAKDMVQRDSNTFLIVRNAADEQFAVPLDLISRIEKIDRADIRLAGGKSAMKYRGTNLVLHSIEETANVQPREDVEHPFVIVFPHHGKEVGIIVSHIVDVIPSVSEIDEVTFCQNGILGSAIILDRITLLLDIYTIVTGKLPNTQQPVSTPLPVPVPADSGSESQGRPTVLIVEDSNFFLNQIRKFTEEAGYQVLTSMDGSEALQVFQEHGENIDLVLTDIEMPNMDGLELTRRLRKSQSGKRLPVLALTSVAGEESEQKALEAGIDEYLIKLDREKVLERMQHYISSGRA